MKMNTFEDRNYVLQKPILLEDEVEVGGQETNFSDQEGLRWEAAAMGLASIFLGLGLLGLLFSLCTVCLKRKRSKEKIVFREKGSTSEYPRNDDRLTSRNDDRITMTSRNDDRITSLYNSIQIGPTASRHQDLSNYWMP